MIFCQDFVTFATTKKTHDMKVLSKSIIAIIVALMSVGIASATDKSKLAKEYVKKFQRQLALPDRADYSDEFYYQNYLTSLTARDEMPWGKSVPEREFEHFVLPVRVNNENLDTARMVFYRELRDRVKSLSMEDAILEVNHWCHEKVSYRPSDARTSSPLATMRTAYGRCGEESTFLVAALRSVCIPARQVYTPRWAHTDDNHAWVEAWANGKWYFLGACEPEPVLNLGWFNESASRGMLMHTKVVGDWDDQEEVMSRTPCYTEINVTGNYAPTSRVDIVVVDSNDMPVPGATVEFKLYNYAEFYTVAKKTTDANGCTFLTAGRGDLLVWVTKDDMVAVRKVSWTQDNVEKFTLTEKSLPEHIDIEIVPPPASAVMPDVTAEQRALNDYRKAQEDSIRHAYEATMPVEEWRGNHRTIQQFFNKARNKVMAQKLLNVISDKDLRDINLDVLRDNEVAKTNTTDIYCRYVLCPRVENEWLTPYKAFFRKEFKGYFLDDLISWTKNNITIDNEHNPQHLRQQPMSVYRERKGDELGRAIFFVSAARSIGWPTRINEVNGKLEFYTPFHGGGWREVNFEESIFSKQANYGSLKLNFTPTNEHNDLAYYTHFTLSKLENNTPQLLTYPEDATWSKTFKNGITLESGSYMLTTGNRQSDGSVMASTTTFEIQSDQETEVALALNEMIQRKLVEAKKIKNLLFAAEGKQNKFLLSSDCYNIVGIIAPGNEPTTHALHDIETCSSELESMGCNIVLLCENAKELEKFNRSEFSKLPASVTWGIDSRVSEVPILSESIILNIAGTLKIDNHSRPIFVVTDNRDNVIFSHHGYTIHLGEQILNAIKRHKSTQN